jgi:hypothetical protein
MSRNKSRMKRRDNLTRIIVVKKRIVVVAVLTVLVAASVYAQSWYNGTDFLELVKTGTPQDIQAAINQGARN